RSENPVQFTQGRTTGGGVGLLYDKNQDVLTILDQATVRVGPEPGASTGAMDFAAGTVEFRRAENLIRFDRHVQAVRDAQTMEADAGVAHLAQGGERLEMVELRGQSRVGASGSEAGSLLSLDGQDIDIKYRPDGQAIEHASARGGAALQLNGATPA